MKKIRIKNDEIKPETTYRKEKYEAYKDKINSKRQKEYASGGAYKKEQVAKSKEQWLKIKYNNRMKKFGEHKDIPNPKKNIQEFIVSGHKIPLYTLKALCFLAGITAQTFYNWSESLPKPTYSDGETTLYSGMFIENIKTALLIKATTVKCDFRETLKEIFRKNPDIELEIDPVLKDLEVNLKTLKILTGEKDGIKTN